MFNIRTDLAMEAREIVKERTKQEIPGVEVDVDRSKNMVITRVKITTREAEKTMGKPQGNYITLEVPKLRERDKILQEEVSKNLAEEIQRVTNFSKKDVKTESTILIVGLGNWNVTPDALGPKVVHNLLVTRHLIRLAPEKIDEGVRSVCALAPGVLGITGIETGEIIQGVVDKVKPELIIAIDSLASRKMERVSTTIQIADTGIHPGSGVNNKRMAITKETLGVPVIAVGVPTVVDAATMANDTIDMVVEAFRKQAPKNSEFYKMLQGMDKNEKYQLIREVIYPYVGNLMVTPKEIDTLIEDMSRLIAGGLNVALHPSVTYEEVTRYLN